MTKEGKTETRGTHSRELKSEEAEKEKAVHGRLERAIVRAPWSSSLTSALEDEDAGEGADGGADSGGAQRLLVVRLGSLLRHLL